MPIDLINVAKYYNALPHQDKALTWLSNQIPDTVLETFAQKFRTPLETTNKASINWSDMNSNVSKYFTVKEVTNNDIRRIPKSDKIKHNILDLAEELDKIREAWKSPIIVTSWYRPPDINASIGGAKYSQHIQGTAVDIKPAKGNIYYFQYWLDKGLWKNKALGYGAKKGFVHIDLRQGRIRWNY